MALEEAQRKPAKHWINIYARVPNEDGKGYELAQLCGAPVYEDGLPMIPVSPTLKENNPDHHKLATMSNPLRRAVNETLNRMSPGEVKALEKVTETDSDGNPVKAVKLICEVEFRMPADTSTSAEPSPDEKPIALM